MIREEHRIRWFVFVILYLLAVVWLSITFCVLLLQGFSGGLTQPLFKLDEKTMLAFLGIGATNILGLLLIAAKYVFPNRPWWMSVAHEQSRPRNRAR